MVNMWRKQMFALKMVSLLELSEFLDWREIGDSYFLEGHYVLIIFQPSIFRCELLYKLQAGIHPRKLTNGNGKTAMNED